MVADFHVAKQFCDMEAIYTYEVGVTARQSSIPGIAIVQLLAQQPMGLYFIMAALFVTPQLQDPKKLWCLVHGFRGGAK